MRDVIKNNEYLYILCQNSGFSTIFLYDHLDDVLIKLLKFLEEERELYSPQQDSHYGILLETNLQCRNSILKVFSIMCDQQSGLNSYIIELESENPDYNRAMVEGEDIPHISHIQDVLKILNKILLIPKFIVKRIFASSASN